MLLAECLVVCLVEWAAWVAWVEWECKHIFSFENFKNAREINHSGVFFFVFNLPFSKPRQIIYLLTKLRTLKMSNIDWLYTISEQV